MDQYLEKSIWRKVWLEKLKPSGHSCFRSDLLRVLLLEKYGGAYLDYDTISMLPIPIDIPNFAVHGKLSLTC